MKRTRSLSMLLISGVAVGALVSSCTIETKSSDGSGGSSSGTTGGTSSGTTGGSVATTGGSETTTGGSAATTGGAAATTGGSVATTGGSSAAGAGGDDTQVGGNGGAGNAGAGAGGEGGASFDDCDTCLNAKCTAELDACLEDTVCFSEAGDGSGQYEQVAVCVDRIRTTRPVKRTDLRDCGNSVGSSLSTLWPPEEMSVATVDLINCMATGVANEAGNSAWANQQNVTNAWAPASCAKLACTSQLP